MLLLARVLLLLLLSGVAGQAGQPDAGAPSELPLLERVRVLEAENALLRHDYGLEPAAAMLRTNGTSTGTTGGGSSGGGGGGGANLSYALRRRAQAAPNVTMPTVPTTPEVPSMESLLPPPPPAPPCEDPENCACFGGWSACTVNCERANQRVFSEGRAPTGTGVPCPTATDCGLFGLQDGEFVLKLMNFVMKLTNFVFKMMILIQTAR